MLQQAQILMRSGGHDLPIVPRRLLEHDLCALRDRRDAGQLRKYALGALHCDAPNGFFKFQDFNVFKFQGFNIQDFKISLTIRSFSRFQG